MPSLDEKKRGNKMLSPILTDPYVYYGISDDRPKTDWWTPLDFLDLSNYLVYLENWATLPTLWSKNFIPGAPCRRFMKAPFHTTYYQMQLFKSGQYPKVHCLYDHPDLHVDYRCQTAFHRLVAMAFFGNPNLTLSGRGYTVNYLDKSEKKQKFIVRHLDDDPNNYLVTNLLWGTHSDNKRDYYKNKREREQKCRTHS
jgi:hypothetical protein